MSTDHETHSDASTRLEQAYRAMLQQIADELEAATERSAGALDAMVEHAREQVATVQALSEEEAERAAAYVRRDLHDLGTFLDSTPSDWRAWLRIDLALIEAKLLDALALVADRTKVEWAELAARAYRVGEWHTGEITGPGELVCLDCGGHLHLTRVGRIPPCPHCHKTQFRRGGPAPEGSE